MLRGGRCLQRAYIRRRSWATEFNMHLQALSQQGRSRPTSCCSPGECVNRVPSAACGTRQLTAWAGTLRPAKPPHTSGRRPPWPPHGHPHVCMDVGVVTRMHALHVHMASVRHVRGGCVRGRQTRGVLAQGLGSSLLQAWPLSRYSNGESRPCCHQTCCESA